MGLTVPRFDAIRDRFPLIGDAKSTSQKADGGKAGSRWVPVLFVAYGDGQQVTIDVGPETDIGAQEAWWLARDGVTRVDRGRRLSSLDSGGRTPVGAATGDDDEESAIQTRTLVVDRSETAAYRSISEAVAAASAGDRVLVRPGLWLECVILDKAITLDGDGDADAVVLVGTNSPAAIVSADGVRITGLTLTGAGAAKTNGILVIGADARVERVTVRDGQSAGIRVHGGSSPTIETSQVFGNGLAGIVVGEPGEPASNPVIRGNTVRDGHDEGIVVFDGSGPLIESNEFFGNAENAIFVTGVGANPVIRGNTVRDGKSGIQVVDGAAPTIESNDVYGNAWVGISVAGVGTHPIIRGNTVRDGRRGGILVMDGAVPTIESNSVYGNAVSHYQSGIEVMGPGTDPLICGNSVRDGQGDGILVYEGASPTIEANEICGKGRAGIFVNSIGSDPLIRGNRVRDGQGIGLFVCGGASPTIEANEVYGNAMGDIDVTGAGEGVVLRSNKSGK